MTVVLPVHAQYMINSTKTDHVSIDFNNKQYDITYKSSDLVKITAVKYDADAQSILFSVTSDNEAYEIIELQVSPQTFLELLTMGPDCSPEETFLLANGVELDYKVYGGNSVMWRFAVPPNTIEIELIGASHIGQGYTPQIKGIEKIYQLFPEKQIVLKGKLLDSCGAPIKDWKIILSTTGLPMPRGFETVSDNTGSFEFTLSSSDLEGINIVKGVLYGETEYSRTPLYDIDFLIPIASLKQQIENSILPENLMCREKLMLIFKYDDSPACVKPETIPKLIERGWVFSSITVPKDSDLVVPRGDLFLKQSLIIEGLN
ncbi:MAG: hypothetical protein ACREAK_02455, partial [Nitrosarchaeum sp.]